MIFCVEDDSSVRELMLYTLNAAGFETAGFEGAGEFWAAVRGHVPELVLLDIMLPGEDGISILKDLRSRAATAAVPVIMTTAKGAEYDKVMALDLGADDYLAKPFGMMEMVSRVKAVLRRSGGKRPRLLRCGGLELDTEAYTVSADKTPVQLTLKEYQLLRLLLENPRRVFTRDQLLEQIWGTDYAGETRTVDMHIATLRTKLGNCGRLIETVRGVGYRMGDGG